MMPAFISKEKCKSHLFSPVGSMSSSPFPHRQLGNVRVHARLPGNRLAHNRNLFV